jgi:signal transduction histidine kinase
VAFTVEAEGTLAGQVDTEKIQRVLLNLLSNAFKFTPDGGRIRCRVGREDGPVPRARIEVADSGPGIAAENRDVVFDRFRQLEGGATRRHGGTGLGLAIARDFVTLHGGTIAIDRAPEGGALFTVVLPLEAPEGATISAGLVDKAPGPAPAPAERVEGAAPAPLAGDPGHPLVLIIEDNPEMNRFIRQTLASEYRTDFALNGADGLRKALETRPDLIVSDVMMPEMSGDALLREVRARAELADTPLLLLSAKADEELRVRLLREGANDYVMKPFAVEELRARVGNLVAARRLAAQLERSNKELESFSYSVSHDLRAPLRAIDGFSAALLEDHGSSLPEEGQRLLGAVRDEAKRMGRLIDDLLEFSRLGRKELETAPVDLGSLARTVVAELRRADPERQVEVTIAELPGVRGDLALLRQVLTNLIGNAFKFTRHRPDAKIEIGARRDGTELVYYVRDNGAGFDMRYAHNLFGVFQRLHATEEFEGTGVGLALVQRIVQRHGGRVWGEGRVNEGATFSFTVGA